MAKEFKSFTLVPKEGRGLITARSPQVLADYLDSASLLRNLLVKDGAWRFRAGDDITDLLANSTGPVYGIHYYNAIDPAFPSASPVTVVLVHSGMQTNGAGTATLRRSDNGSIVTVNGTNFTTGNPSDIFFLNIKNRCFVTGLEMSTDVVPTIVTSYPTATSYQWGVYAPTNDMTYDAYTDVTNTTTKLYYQSAGANVTAGSTTVTRATGTWDTTNWDGKTVMLNDVPYTIVDVTDANTMTINPAWVDDGATSPVNMRVQWGEVSWLDLGPKYAMAYYNPDTGHCSSIGPVMTISETQISDVRVKLSNIMLTDDPNYTRVVIFRTAFDNGGVLLPLKLDAGAAGTTATVDTDPASAGYGMIENTSVGAVEYVDILADSQLGQILGPVQAPIFNNPPPADMRYMAYWDQRVWCVSAATRYRLQFSGNSSEIQLGVSEESFPDSYYRDIPADDGFITGLKVVGTSLLVCTERYLYFVDGGSADTYRLTRISSRGAGVDQHAIDEHPGDSSEQSASAIYVSRDKRLWRQFPGGRVEDIGWPIQDKLDNIDLDQFRPVMLRVAQVGKSWLLVLGIRESNTQYGYLFYDFDEKSWLDLNFATSLMLGVDWNGSAGANAWSGIGTGIVYGSSVQGRSRLDIGTDQSNTIQRFGIMQSASGDIGLNPSIRTQFLDLGDKQSKKSFQELIVHTDLTGAIHWNAVLNFDDDPVVTYELTQVPDTSSATSPRYMGGEVIRFKLGSDQGAPNQFHTVRVLLNMWDSTGVTTDNQIFKIVLNYTVESTGISGSIT